MRTAEAGPRVSIKVASKPALSMRIAAPKAETFRSIKTGNDIKLTQFNPAPLSPFKEARKPFSPFSFEKSVPFIAPTIGLDVKPKPEVKPMLTRFIGQPAMQTETKPKTPLEKRFGEFKIQSDINLAKGEKTITLPQFENKKVQKPQSELKTNSGVASRLSAIRQELQTMPGIMPKFKKDEERWQQKPNLLEPSKVIPLTGDRVIPKVEPSATEIATTVKEYGVDAAQKILTVKYQSPISKAQLTTAITQEKTQTLMQPQQKTLKESSGGGGGGHGKIYEAKVLTPTIVAPKEKIDYQAVIIDFGAKKPDDEKKKEVKYIKDKGAMMARKAGVMLWAALLYAEKVYNTFGRFTGLEKDTLSGKEFAGKMTTPSKDMISGLAKEMGTEDNTLALIDNQISQMPTTESLGEAIGFMNNAIDEHVAVDIEDKTNTSDGDSVTPTDVIKVIMGSALPS